MPTVPIVVSILAVIAWLLFILLYALYWSNGFSLFQNVIVTIVSLMITALLVGLMWTVWGSRRSWNFEEYGWESRPKKQ
ncbi:MAG: hypothetical protein LYZ70_01320 [Nitrososphaerales archaeon]|nr:hypothetical protein [Nitrososphaerales archaeon]